MPLAYRCCRDAEVVKNATPGVFRGRESLVEDEAVSSFPDMKKDQRKEMALWMVVEEKEGVLVDDR